MRNLNLLIYLLLIAIVSNLTIKKSYAYKLNGLKWASSEYNYYINPIGVDNEVDYSQYSSVIIDGASVWTSSPTTSVNINYMGTTTVTEWGGTWPPDYQNTITWKTDGWSGNTIGLATYWYVGDEIVDSDIKLNTAFAADSRLGKLVTHEVGHSLGIGHTREAGQSYTQDEYEAIMYYLLHGSNQFNAHDKCAITAIYPLSGSCSPTFSEGYHEPQPCCSGEATISVSVSNNTHTYSGTAKNVSVSTSPSGIAYTVSYLNNLSQTVTPVNAGTYDVVITITEPDYEDEGPFYDQLIINKKNLAVTANNQTVNYGEPEPDYTLTYSGLVSGETPDDLLLKPTAYIVPNWPAEPGTHIIYLNNGESNNYNLSYNTGILTINGNSVNSVVFTNTSHVYDGNPKSVTITSDPPDIQHTVKYSINGQAVQQPTNSNFYDVILTITEEGYYPDTFTSVLEIEKVSLLVEAQDTTIHFGVTEPQYTILTSGFVQGETELNLTNLPSASIETDWPVLPGTYPIITAGGEANNYSFNYINGTLIVLPATIDSLLLAENTMIYNGSFYDPLITTYPEQVNVSISYIQNENSLVQVKDAGTYQIEIIIDEPGYEADTTHKTLTIHKATLIATANDTTITYGDDEPQYTYTYNGFIGDDNEDNIENHPEFANQFTWPPEPGTYQIELINGSDNNYSISAINGTLTIEKALLNVLVNNQIITYGDNLPELDYSISGFVYNDDESIINQMPLAYINETGNLNVGTYIIYANDGADIRYNFNYTNGELSIEPATLTYSADTIYITYGDNNFNVSYQISGFVHNDDVSVIEQLPEPSQIENWPWDAGTYTLEVDGGEANNYTFNYMPLILNISKAELELTPDNISISYGQSLPEFTYHLSGFVYSDDESSILDMPSLYIEDSEPLEAGTHTIFASGGYAINYSFIYHEGSLWVEPLGTVEILNRDTSFVYKGQVFELEAITEPQGAIPTIEYNHEPLNAGNYYAEITAVKPGYISANKTIYIFIEKALLEVTAHNITVLSHEDQPDFSFDISGFVNDENENVLLQMPIATINSSWPPTAGTHIIEVGNASATNYNFNYNSATLTIIQTYLIEVSAESNGLIQVEGHGSPVETYSEYIVSGENSPVFTALPNSGYSFSAWNNGNTSNPIVLLNINENISLIAEFELLTGIENHTNSNLVIYPNPIEANKPIEIHISLNQKRNDNVYVQISDINGRILETHNLNSNKINISAKEKGFYIVTVVENNSSIHKAKLLAR